MQTLKIQRADNEFKIVEVIVDDLVIGWTVTDSNLERYTNKNFKTASEAFEWAEVNYRGLFDEK